MADMRTYSSKVAVFAGPNLARAAWYSGMKALATVPAVAGSDIRSVHPFFAASHASRSWPCSAAIAACRSVSVPVSFISAQSSAYASSEMPAIGSIGSIDAILRHGSIPAAHAGPRRVGGAAYARLLSERWRPRAVGRSGDAAAPPGRARQAQARRAGRGPGGNDPPRRLPPSESGRAALLGGRPVAR